MKKRKRFVVANWKLNPETLAEAKRLFAGIKKAASGLEHVTTVVCPPAVYLAELKKGYRGKKVALGAQDVFFERMGSYTGETSPAMVANIGATYAIIGHSERRANGETDADVRKKVAAATAEKLTAIVCIGESERDEQGAYLSFIREQLRTGLADVSERASKRIIIAYEPIWAIGKTGDDAIQPSDLHETVLFIRKILNEQFEKKTAFSIPILYGGSVERENAGVLFEQGEVDGHLVGHASLDPEEFRDILFAVNNAER